MKTLKNNILDILSGLLLVGGVACVIYVVWAMKSKNADKISVVGDKASGCIDRVAKARMKDDHMTGFLRNREQYEVLVGYYKCNEIKRNDPVWFEFTKALDPVVKFVRALPGDTFSTYQDPKNPGHWNVKINGKVLMYKGAPYFYKYNSTPPLKTYEDARKGKLRDDEYLLFSYAPPGFSDSGNLGIVNKVTIIGRVNKL